MLQDLRLRSSFFAIALGLAAIASACGDDGGTASSGSTYTGPGSGGAAPTTNAGTGGDAGPASTGTGSPTSSSSSQGVGGDPATTTSGSSSDGGGGAGANGAGGDVGQGGAGAGGSGAGGSGGSGGASPECELPESCPDPGSFCLARACTDGACGTSFIDDGTPLPNVDQILGDCRIAVCDGAGGPATDSDDLDFVADANPCTIERCTDGEPEVEPADLGTDCGIDLACDGAGNCVGCITAEDCPGEDDECRTRVCDVDGQCNPTFADAGTLLAAQNTGDCQQVQCDGGGNIVSVDSDGDVPAQVEDCVAPTCTEGEPTDQPIGSGSSCDDDGGSLCDGIGACVECLSAAQCPATTACASYACTLGECVPTFAPDNASAGDPQAGDCRRDECDGAGNIVEDELYNADLPVDLSTCTNNLCTNGTPSNPALPINTACNQNGGTLCNAVGVCVQCTAAAQCPSNVCTGGQCVSAACNDNVSNGNETGTDCGGPDCSDCPNGQGCDTDNDCTSGFCNPNTQICAAPACNDGFQNGNETDIDCGGSSPCSDCGLGLACNGDPDCLSDYCFDGFCATFFCGDGGVNPGEQCDDGDDVNYNGCDTDCRFTCGNSILNDFAPTSPFEGCDDGNRTNGNGCSSVCQVESNYQCTLAPSVCTRQEVRCNNSPSDDDGDGTADASDPDCAWFNLGQVPACSAGQTLYIYNSVRVPQAIPDLGLITNDITVPNIGTVRRVMLRINITHTWDEDLDISLRSPSGLIRDVSSDNGGNGDNFTNTRFRQGQGNLITGGSAPFNGEYRPEGNFDNFNTLTAQGIWRLTVVDDAGTDVGTLNGYQLAICAN